MKFKLNDRAAVRRFLVLIPQRANYAKKMAIIEGYARITVKSPVLTGRFRWGWNCSINGIDYGIPDPAPPEYAKEGRVFYKLDENRAQDTFMNVKIDDDVFIANSLPYAKRLNEGWSRQAPAHFVELTVEEVKSDLCKWAGIAKGMDGGF